MVKIDLSNFEKVVKEIVPLKSEKVINRFKFDYGCLTLGLEKSRIKKTLFHVNYVFKLGANKDHIPENYHYRLTSQEINKILNSL